MYRALSSAKSSAAWHIQKNVHCWSIPFGLALLFLPNFRVGYSVDFFRVRDTNLASCVLELFAMRERNISVLFLQKARVSILLIFFTGTKIKLFDTTPTQFVALAPNIWSWPMWKAGIFMHHDVSILEQVS